MHPLIKDIYHLVLDTLLPVRCVVCETENPKSVCADCLAQFKQTVQARCIVCLQASPYGLTHIQCRSRLSPDRLTAVLNYKHKQVAGSIIAGKYYFVKDVFTVLGSHVALLLETELAQLPANRALVTPLPLYKQRERWRGFNQSSIAAKAIAENAKLPYTETLARTRRTNTQKNLDKTARIKNVLDCFAPLPETKLQGKTIVLVDDVTTTGSTLLEAAKVLKANGAAYVWCFALAQD